MSVGTVFFSIDQVNNYVIFYISSSVMIPRYQRLSEFFVKCFLPQINSFNRDKHIIILQTFKYISKYNIESNKVK